MSFDAIESEMVRTCPLNWSLKNTLLGGKPFVLNGPKIKGDSRTERLRRTRPFLEDPLRDKAQKKCYYKPRQGGWSEISVREALWFCCEQDDVSCAYTFSRPDTLRDFSHARVKKTINESGYVKSRCNGIDNVGFKEIGKSYLYLRARSNPECGEGIDADALFNDELDRGNIEAVISFAETLKSSRYGLVRDISTPTIAEHGVHASWGRSDKKRWFNFCEKCGEANGLTMDSIVEVSKKKRLGEGRYDYICEGCRTVGRIDRSNGMWWPEITDVQMEYSGYHMNQLAYPWLTADDIMLSKKNFPFYSQFVNYVLGQVYAGDNVLITRSHVEDCVNEGFEWKCPPVSHEGYKSVRVGIDWGDTSWAVVWMPHGGRRLILDVIEVEGLENDDDMRDFMNRLAVYDPVMIVADAGYGKDRIAKMRKKFGKKRVYACYYPTTAIDSDAVTRMIEPNWDTRMAKVSVDRVASLKEMAGTWRDKEWILPHVDSDISETFKKHLTSLTSLKRISERRGEMYEMVLSGGPDHLAHACNYAMIAGLRNKGRSTIIR